MLLLSVLFLPLFFSCTMENRAILEGDGSGEFTFNVTMKPFLVDYIKEMSDLAGGANQLPGGAIFDLPKIKEDLEKKPGIKVTSLSTPNPSSLTGTFTFKDIEAVFESEKLLTETGVVSFSRAGGENRLSLRVSRENFSQIAELFPQDSRAFIDMFGPQENDNITKDEYLEMMEFAMGENAPPAIRQGKIDLTVQVKGNIISQKGGTIRGNSVVFSIPLLDALLLQKPLDYSIVFK